MIIFNYISCVAQKGKLQCRLQWRKLPIKAIWGVWHWHYLELCRSFVSFQPQRGMRKIRTNRKQLSIQRNILPKQPLMTVLNTPGQQPLSIPVCPKVGLVNVPNNGVKLQPKMITTTGNRKMMVANRNEMLQTETRCSKQKLECCWIDPAGMLFNYW